MPEEGKEVEKLKIKKEKDMAEGGSNRPEGSWPVRGRNGEETKGAHDLHAETIDSALGKGRANSDLWERTGAETHQVCSVKPLWGT